MISQLVAPLEALEGLSAAKLDSGEESRIGKRLSGPRETFSGLLSMSGSVRLAEYSRGFTKRELLVPGERGPIPATAEPPSLAIREIRRVQEFADSRIAGLRAAAGGRLARVRAVPEGPSASEFTGATPSTGLSRFKTGVDLQLFIEELSCLTELESATTKKKKAAARQTAAAEIAAFVSEPFRALLLKNIKSVRGELEVVRVELGQTMTMLGGAFKAVLELDSVFRTAVAGKVGKNVITVIDGVDRGLAQRLAKQLEACDSRAEVLAKVPGWFAADGEVTVHGQNLLRLGDGLLELEFEDLDALLAVASEYAAALEGELLLERENA